MTRRTTSRAPGMFPGRQPSSHPNPCLGGVCSRYAGSERTLRRSRKVHNDGCQAGSRDGFEPPGGVLAPTPRMVSKRDSQRPIGNATGPGRETRRRVRVPQGAAGPTRRRGSHKAPRVPQRAAGMPQPRACHKRREPWPEDRPPAGTTSPRSDRTTRRGIPASAMRRGLRDTPPGGYYKRPLPSRPHDTARVPTSVRVVSLTACRWRVRQAPPTATAGHAAGLVPQCPGSGPGNASRSDAYPAGRWPL